MNNLAKNKGYKHVVEWLKKDAKKPFDFQKETWQYYADGYSGLVNAPTGFGKTFSLFLAVVIEGLNEEALKKNTKNKLRLIWITPLRSLAKDIARAMRETLQELNLDWQVGVRNGDTSQNEKLKQKKSMPEILLITPESLHLLLAQKDTLTLFQNLNV